MDTNSNTRIPITDSHTLKTKVFEYLIQHFPEYKIIDHYGDIKIFIQNALQKDLNITRDVPYLEVRTDYRRRSNGFNIVWSSRPSAFLGKRSKWKDEYLDRESLAKMVRKRIKLLDEAIKKQEADRIAYEQQRAADEAKELARQQAIKTYLEANEIRYQQDRNTIELIDAPHIQIRSIEDDRLHIVFWRQAYRTVMKQSFKDVVKAAHTEYFMTVPTM